jgi:hypothetical protein
MKSPQKKNKIPLGPLMSIDKMAPFENKNKHLMVLRDKYSKIPPIFATQSSEVRETIMTFMPIFTLYRT